MTEKKKRRDEDLEQSSSSTVIKGIVMVTNNDQEESDGFSTRWKNFTYEFRTKEQKLGPIAGTTAVLWFPAVLPPGAFASPGLPVFPSRLPGFLRSSCYVCGVAPNPRIL